MENPEQIERIKQGSKRWNTWKKQHSKEKVDLSGAALHRAHLHRADLSSADLSSADLSSADLSSAILSGATLSGADLSSADLSSADLSSATLRGATLSGAILRGATLSGADLSGATLSGADLSKAYLSEATLSDVDLRFAALRFATLIGVDLGGATLSEANLSGATLSGATLSGATLSGADLRGTDLRGTDLSGANLSGANLSGANLSGANLSGANLSGATLVGTNLTKAILASCSIYGISVWRVQLEGAQQGNLVITDQFEPAITVDNLEVAQFIYLLLNSPKIHDVIDTIAKKAVLILSRSTPERKHVLDALRDELRNQDYLPIVFDLEKPASRDLTETVNTLAHLSRFIIADLTDPDSIPQELSTIILFSIVPVQPLLIQDDSLHEHAMFQNLRRWYHWVLPTFRYQNTESLLSSLKEHVIKPAELKAQELEKH